MRPALSYYLSSQDPVARWANNVSRNGASVSPTRVSAMRRFVEAEKRIGAYGLIDEYWFPWGESANQALVSFKLGLVAVPVSSPTFTANQGYTGDGLSSYVRLGFIPSVHGRAMYGGAGRVESYVRTNQQSSGPTIGVSSGSLFRLFPRNASNAISASVMCAAIASATSVTDCRGLGAAERTVNTTMNFDLNGIELAAGTAASVNNTLPTREFYLLASNNTGTAASFFPGQVGYAAVGAPLVNSALKAAHYANVQQLATDIGANV